MANFLYPENSQDYIKSDGTLPYWGWVAYHGTWIPEGMYRWFICRYKNTTGRKIKITNAYISMTSGHCAAYDEYGESKPAIVDWIVGKDASSYVKTDDIVEPVTYFDSDFEMTSRGAETHLPDLSVIIDKNEYFYVGVRLHSSQTSGGLVTLRVGTSATRATGNFFLTPNPQSEAPQLSDAWFNNNYWDDTIDNAGQGHVVNSRIEWVEAYIPTTSIIVSPESLSLVRGNSYQLGYSLLPTNATNKNVTWKSSNDSVATVSGGYITAKAQGSTIITGTTADGKTASCSVTVYVPTTGIKVTGATSTDFNVSNTVQLIAAVSPSDATNKNVVWVSNNTSIADVVNTGKVTFKKPGTVRITAITESGNFSSSIDIRGYVSPKSISIIPAELDLRVGKSHQLDMAFNPSYTTERGLSWSTQKDAITSVTDTGLIKSLGKGIVNITLKGYGNKTAVCKVNNIRPVSGVSLNASSVILYLANGEDTFTLVPTVFPSDANDKEVYFVSSNDVAVVDSKGVVTAKKPGESFITVHTHDGNFTEFCKIIVRSYASGIIITDKNDVIKRQYDDVNVQFAADVLGNPYDKTVYWSTSDDIVLSVSESGVVTAKKAGTVVITAKAKKSKSTFVSDSITVAVKQLAHSIKINEPLLEMDTGESKTFSVTVLPADTSDKSFDAICNSFYLVKNGGTVTGDAFGETELKVTTKDGTNLSHSIPVFITTPEWYFDGKDNVKAKRAFIFDGNKNNRIKKKWYFDGEQFSRVSK